MGLVDERVIGESRARCEVLTYFLFTSEHKAKLYERMVAKQYFPEFVAVKQKGVWLSHPMMQAQFSFPYRLLPGPLKPLTLDDLYHLVNEEATYRSRQASGTKLLELAAQIHKLTPLELGKQLAEMIRTPGTDPEVTVNGKADYALRKTRSEGIKTGIKQIDNAIGGISFGRIYTIAAYTGSYKTLTWVNYSYNALSIGYHVALITLEIPKTDLYQQFLCRHSYHPKFSTKGAPVDTRLVLQLKLTKEQEDFLYGVVEPDFKALPGQLFLFESGDIQAWDHVSLRALFSTLPVEFDVFGLDYMQLLMFEPLGFKDERQAGNWVLNQFKNLAVGAGETGKPKIGLITAQTNRDGWQAAMDDGGRYTLRALSDLNQLERASYYVQFLYVDEILERGNQVKTQLGKHRGGLRIDVPFTTAVFPMHSVIGDNIYGFNKPVSREEAVTLIDDEPKEKQELKGMFNK